MKWTNEMYLAYYGMSLIQLRRIVYREIYNIKENELCMDELKQPITNVSGAEKEKEELTKDTVVKNVGLNI